MTEAEGTTTYEEALAMKAELMERAEKRNSLLKDEPTEENEKELTKVFPGSNKLGKPSAD